MIYETISNDDLQRFRLQLLEDIKRLINEGSAPKKEWLRSSEVRKMLGISHGTLQNLRIKNILPFRRVGGILYYKYKDIMVLMEKNEHNDGSF
jgi:hypothetical protein